MKRSLAYKIPDRLGLGIFFICCFLVLFGGFQLKFGSAIVEVGDISVWGVLLSLFLLGFLKTKNDSRLWYYYQRTIDRVLQNGGKYFGWGLFWFFFVLFVAHFTRFLTLNTNTWDMGIVHNALNFPYGPKFLSCEICRNQTYMGEHPAFSFALITPITSFLKSTIFIISLQKLLIVAGLYLIGVHGPLKDSPQLRAWWLFLVAANEGLRAGLLFDFREDEMMYFFFMLSAWGIYRGRSWALFGGVLGALASKENAFATSLMMAGTLLFVQECPWTPSRRRIYAFILVLMSFTYVFLNFKFFIPYFVGETGQTKMALLERFPGMGNTPQELLLNFLRNPFAFIWKLSPYFFTLHALRYATLVSIVGLFVGWRKWPWLLPALPPLIFNLISAGPGQRDLAYHYDLILTCWLAVAMAFALKDLSRDPVALRKKLQVAIVLALITFARSPLFYAFDFISHDGHSAKAGWDAQFLHPAEPLAGDSFVATTFSHLKSVRFFNTIELNNRDRIGRITEFYRQTPRKNNDSEGRCAQDARSFAVRGNHPDQAWLIPELILAGGKEIYRSHDTYDNSALVVFELEKPLFDIWCEKDHLCQDEMFPPKK